jgi:hypothetical protein
MTAWSVPRMCNICSLGKERDGVLMVTLLRWFLADRAPLFRMQQVQEGVSVEPCTEVRQTRSWHTLGDTNDIASSAPATLVTHHKPEVWVERSTRRSKPIPKFYHKVTPA